MSKLIGIPPAVAAQMEGRPLECVVSGCSYERTTERAGPCEIVLECARCGSQIEKDVS